MKKYSIIIPVCGEIETTKRCIDSINANTNDHEIIIIDNGSEPEYYGQEKIIRNEENKGFPVAVNQGIKEAKGEVIIILNNDTIVTENWLKKIGKHLENFDIVGPVTNNISGPQKIDGLASNLNAAIEFFARKTETEKNYCKRLYRYGYSFNCSYGCAPGFSG